MKWQHRIGIASLVLVVLLTGMMGSIWATPGQSGSKDVRRTTDLLSGGEGQGLVIVTPQTVRTGVFPPDKLWLPLFVTVPKGGRAKELKEVTVEIGGRLARFDATTKLEAQEVETVDLVEKIKKADEATGLLKKGKYMPLEIDVSGLPLKEGDLLPVNITARALEGEQVTETTVSSTYAVMSLPTRSGWYAGDGHIHTAWSPDVVVVSIDGRANSAKNSGLKWIVITDHQDGIDDGWLTYVSQCGTAQNVRDRKSVV